MSLPQPEINVAGLSAFLSCLGRALADLDCMSGNGTAKWILAQTDNSYGDLVDCQRLNAFENHTFQLMHCMLDIGVGRWRDLRHGGDDPCSYP